MKKTAHLLLCCISTISSGSLLAQKGINSIYSAYGIGDYQMRDPNSFTAMGGAGVAVPSQYSINELNPSSFAWLPQNNFRLELGLSGISTRYSNEYVNTTAGDFSISRIAFAAQVLNPIQTVIGLRRFSRVEYYTQSLSREIEGSGNQLLSDVEGNGGLYQVYAGNALKVTKNLAFGLQTGFIFGSINTTETMAVNATESLISDGNKYYHQASVNTGIQYKLGGKKTSWILGAFYEPQVKLNVEETRRLLNENSEVLAEKENSYSKFLFPQKFGAGIYFTQQSFSASVDLVGHLWESTGYKGAHFTTANAYSLSAGIKHQFVRTSIWGETPGISIMAGFNRETGYLVVGGRQMETNAFTFGATFPSKNNLHYYTAGGRVGSRGVSRYPLVKENFFEFNFSLSLGGFLYKERKYD